MKISGQIVRKRVAPGSKSEHDAVVIVAKEGEFILRRSGGNPFVDPELEKLVGKSLKCDGTLHGQHFIMSDWAEVDQGQP
jgi:phosphoglucomutase